MKKRYTCWIAMVLIACAISCKENKKAAVEKLVTEWIGKEVIFPVESNCTYMGKDTICPNLSSAPYKILVYTDSMGCTSCKLNLHVWKVYMEEVAANMPGRVDFLFYFQPKDQRELEYLLRRERLEHPVFIDDKGELNQINKFPKGMEYQCFLLDRDNKVSSIGNPALNPQIWEIYKQVIKNAKE